VPHESDLLVVAVRWAEAAEAEIEEAVGVLLPAATPEMSAAHPAKTE